MQHPHICSCSLIDSFHSPLVISRVRDVPLEECTMCVYIQVNIEITICRPEQITQARLGCSGDLDQTNKNTGHHVFFVVVFFQKGSEKLENCKHR